MSNLNTMRPLHAAMANAMAATKPLPGEKWQLLQWVQDLRVISAVLAAQSEEEGFDADYFLAACGWHGTEHT